jgi:FkbM family methyltransferase
MSIRTISIEGQRFDVEAFSGKEEHFWNAYESGEWERTALKFMLEHRKGAVFLDIGSWIGPVSLLMSKYYEKVITVDFDPVANKSFRHNLSLNKTSNVTLHEIGLSDRAGKATVNADDLGSSETSLYGKPLGKTLEVDLIRFDEFINRLPERDRIGFIKIDCEGAEYKFLDQVYRFASRQKVMVTISYHPFVLRRPYYYVVKLYHWIRQLPFRRYYFTSAGNIVVKSRFVPLFRLVDNFPMADVIAS